MFQAANFSIRMPLPVASGDAGGDAGMQFGDFGAYPRKKDFYLLDFLIFSPIFSFSPYFPASFRCLFPKGRPLASEVDELNPLWVLHFISPLISS